MNREVSDLIWLWTSCSVGFLCHLLPPCHGLYPFPIGEPGQVLTRFWPWLLLRTQFQQPLLGMMPLDLTLYCTCC